MNKCEEIYNGNPLDPSQRCFESGGLGQTITFVWKTIRKDCVAYALHRIRGAPAETGEQAKVDDEAAAVVRVAAELVEGAQDGERLEEDPFPQLPLCI